MTSPCTKLPVGGHTRSVRQIPTGPAAERTGHPLGRVPNASNNNVQSQLAFVTRERDALRSIVVKLSNNIQLAAGQKRKELSDVPDSERTRDPRKRLRVLSAEETLQAKIVEQDKQISELKNRVTTVLEESKTRRHTDELELNNMRTCLKDLMDKVDDNQELIQKLESEVALKEKAMNAASAALEATIEELAAAKKTVSNIEEKVNYLERDRKLMKADVYRHRANSQHIFMHYKCKMERLELEVAWRRTLDPDYTEGSSDRGDSPGSSDDATERAAHLPQSRSRVKAVDGSPTS